MSQKQRARDLYEAWAVGRDVLPWARVEWSEKNIWRNYVAKLSALHKARAEGREALRALESYKKSHEPS